MKRMLEFAVRIGHLTVVNRRAIAGDVAGRLARQWVLAYVAPWVWVVGA